MSKVHTEYLPAAGRDWLLPLYDPLTWLFGVESAHLRLADQAALRPGQRVLEVGCGTGNLLLLAKRLQPKAELTGLDPDPKALSRARAKAARKGLRVTLDRGFGGALPYDDEGFDRVLSAFMFHHLDEAEKARTLREVARVLKPGGSLHLVDFASAHGPMKRRTAANAGDAIPAAMRDAGLGDAYEIARARSRVHGEYAFFRAHRE